MGMLTLNEAGEPEKLYIQGGLISLANCVDTKKYDNAPPLYFHLN